MITMATILNAFRVNPRGRLGGLCAASSSEAAAVVVDVF